jgi:hypothetical protein
MTIPMIKLLLILILNPCYQIDHSQILKDGKYIVQFNSMYKSNDYLILIKGDSYIRYYDNDTIKGNIKQLDDKYLIFKDISKTDLHDTSRVTNIIHDSFGDMCIEILKPKRNGFSFRTTYTGNLHITINEGIIKRLRTNGKLDKP